MTARLDKSFWAGKKVLVTGHTGFKGSWLTIYLKHLGCEVIGVGLKPDTDPALFEIAGVTELCDSHIVDLRDRTAIQTLLEKTRPDIVLHLAAQALVYRGYEDPHETYSSNIMGTVNLLEGLRQVGSSNAIVMVTSDKVYQTGTSLEPYSENDALGGDDPYSASKAATELIVASYRQAFLKNQGISIATARAGNVIGGGDWASARLIPDAVREWSENKCLMIRHPQSIRPWQHVLEPLHGYLLLAEKLSSSPHSAGAYNFGPDTEHSHSVEYVVKLAEKNWPGAEIQLSDTPAQFNESAWLLVDSTKSKIKLGFAPVWSTEVAVERTMNWYRSYAQGDDALNLCMADIANYEVSSGSNND